MKGSLSLILIVQESVSSPMTLVFEFLHEALGLPWLVSARTRLGLERLWVSLFIVHSAQGSRTRQLTLILIVLHRAVVTPIDPY